MRGRKPVPVEQREANGNPGKRPLPVPVTVGGAFPKAPSPPRNLPKEGKDFWKVAVPILHEIGLLDKVDTAALEMCCTAYARVIECRRVIAKDGLFTTGSVGQIREHPAVATERAEMATFLRFAEQYALTPVARTRLGLAEIDRHKGLQELAKGAKDAPLTPAT